MEINTNRPSCKATKKLNQTNLLLKRATEKRALNAWEQALG